jgi:hypothetical protein
LLDPRGQLQRSRLELARRPDRAALAAMPVLFYDNAKMDVGHYGLIFERIKAGLRANGITRFTDWRESIRGKSSADILRLAECLSGKGAGAAVLGLADMGVSPAMVTLTVALERLGIPAVCVTAGPGAQLCKAHASYRAGSLCLCDLDLHPGSSREVVEREADAAVAGIVAMLGAGGAALEALSRIDYPVDRSPVASDGCISIDDAPGHDDLEAVFERFEALHIGDGLPFLPPTLQRYERMRRYCAFDPGKVVIEGVGPSGTPIRIKDVIVSCVMAGCKPEYVPVVLTAVRAISRPRYNLLQAVTTSHGGGHFLVASGPLAAEIGMHGGQGCLGPGFRANASIGRAVNLVVSNVCRSVPGFADLACLSSPAEYSYCMAEPTPTGAWPGINEEHFGRSDTCVMALMAESPHSIMDLASTTAQGLMETIIDCCTTLGSNNAYVPGALVLVLNPDHARMLREGGYDKDRIRREVHAGARVELARLGSRGLVSIANADRDAGGMRHVTRTPADTEVVVAGGRGGHSAVILPWALHSDPVYEGVRLPDGKLATRLDEFVRR